MERARCAQRRTQAVSQEDFSITGAVLAASTFAFWVTVLAYVTWRWRRAGAIIDGVPLVIVQDGEPIMRTLKTERLPLSEVYEAARQNGLETLETVRLAVLEPTGRISFITGVYRWSNRSTGRWPRRPTSSTT